MASECFCLHPKRQQVPCRLSPPETHSQRWECSNSTTGRWTGDAVGAVVVSAAAVVDDIRENVEEMIVAVVLLEERMD